MNNHNKAAQSQLRTVDTPKQGASFIEKGAALLAEGDLKQALIAFQNAISATPDNALAYYNAGVACHQLGLLDQAIAYYTDALNKNGSFIQALYNLGIAHSQNQAPHKSIPFFLKALELKPDYADALYNLGIAYERTGENEKALLAYQQTLRVTPNHARALNNIGLLTLDNGKTEGACAYFKRALSVDPELAEAHYNLGMALQCQGDIEKARLCYRHAMEADPHYAPAKWMYHLSLPSVYHHFKQIEAERKRFSENLAMLIKTTPLNTESQKKEALRGVGTTTNFFLPCHAGNDLNLQKRYGRFVCDVMAANFPNWSRPKPLPALKPTERIRIGYVSSLMYSHTVGDFLLGWVKHHSQQEFEVFCYHLGQKFDTITEHLRSNSDHFIHLPHTIESAAQAIEADNLHILFYPEIGMCARTIQLAALRLAPVQCATWWHPVTTGLPTMDYYLAGELIETDQARQYYSEQLVLLPNVSLCYTPPAKPSSPKTRDQLGIPHGRFVYLSPQSLHKYLPQDDDLYPQIAIQVPEALFVFISDKHDGITEIFKERLHKAFKKYNLESQYFCIFMPRLNHADFLSLNLCADLLLDTLEWSGGHTTIEAVSCGLPVVTLPGPFLRSLTTYGLLKMIGINATIAKNKDDYCRIAVRMAKEPRFHADIRSQLQRRVDRLYNDGAFMKALENFYKSCLTDGPDSNANNDHYHKGMALQQTGRLEEATACYRQALKLTPEKDEIHLALGGCLKVQSDYHGAEQCFQQVLRTNPFHPEAAFSLGTLYLQCNNIDAALEWLQKAHQVKPDWGLLQNNLGNAYLLKGNDKQALACLKKAIGLEPDLADAWFNLAELDTKTGDFEQAIPKYRKAIRINPTMLAAHNNMGNAQKECRKYDEAIASFKTVLSQSPELPQGHYNLGDVYRLVENYDKAIMHLSQAVHLKPDYAEAWNNLALTFKNMGALDNAMRHFNQALVIAPDMAEARWNRSFVNFLMGHWLEGWNDFEARFAIPQWRTLYPHRIEGLLWDGVPIPDKTLLVHDEQGLGDTIQFARLLPWARQRCGHLILETRQELVPLLQNNPAIDTIAVRAPTRPPAMHFDCYVPLMSLARLANMTPEIAAPTSPYLTAESVKIDQWKERLPKEKSRVGLVWAGRPQHGNDANRSLNIQQLAPLFRNREIQFIGLQKGPSASQAEANQWPNFVNIGPSLDSFADTAAVLAQLDLLITVDTAVAHLAGAMGRPVWVLIPFVPDWRWGMQGERTPWYPEMRLYRQHRPKAWQPVIDRIGLELKNNSF